MRLVIQVWYSHLHKYRLYLKQAEIKYHLLSVKVEPVPYQSSGAIDLENHLCFVGLVILPVVMLVHISVIQDIEVSTVTYLSKLSIDQPTETTDTRLYFWLFPEIVNLKLRVDHSCIIPELIQSLQNRLFISEKIISQLHILFINIVPFPSMANCLDFLYF